jgi:hypothetical protein
MTPCNLLHRNQTLDAEDGGSTGILETSVLIYETTRSQVPPCDTITGLDRPLGFQEVQDPRFLDSRPHESGKVVSPTHRPPLLPSKYSWYSFLLETESTLAP